ESAGPRLAQKRRRKFSWLSRFATTRCGWSPRAPADIRSFGMVLRFLRALVAPKAPEPSYPDLPWVGEGGRSSVPGIHLAGEVAGLPLLRLGMNAGHELVERLAPEIARERDAEEGVLDLLIVGAGAAGLAAAARAKALGLSSVTVDANHIAETVEGMT